MFFWVDDTVCVYWRGQIYGFACVLFSGSIVICKSRFAGCSVYSIHPYMSWFECIMCNITKVTLLFLPSTWASCSFPRLWVVLLLRPKNISGVWVKLIIGVVVFFNCILHWCEWMHQCCCVVWVCECRKTHGL